MKKSWPMRFGLSVIVTGCAWLSGCSSQPHGGTYTGPTTQAYVVSGTFTSILEYSTAPADNGSLIGTLALPASFYGYVVATDSTAQIYVAGVAPGLCQILIYSADSTGEAVPSRTINLPGSSCISALAIDPTGRIYAAGQSLNGVSPTVSVYPATANGTATPLRTLTLAGIGTFNDLAADAAGNIYAAGTIGVDGPFSVQVYSPTSTGSAIPTRTITSAAAVGIDGVAVDSAGDIFADVQLSNTDYAIEEFAPGVDGTAAPINTIQLPQQSATIASGGPVRLDSGGNLFTALRLLNNIPPSTETYIIYGFGSTATGSPTPTVQITPTNAFFNNEDFALN
jgi:hypothetical protein